MSRKAVRRRVTRIRVGGRVSRRDDFLAAEEPLEIRVQGSSLAVTMRTPGHDFELAAGFLVSEGIIRRSDDFATARYCAGAEYPGAAEPGNTYNVLDVSLAPGVEAPDPSLARNFTTTSACGLCGKASIDQVRTEALHDVASDPLRIDAALLSTFPDCCARVKTSSSGPAACTPQRSSTARPDSSWCSAKTWGGTTPSTRPSAGRS